MTETYEVRFPRTRHAPVRLMAHARLSEHLTVVNSPVLFGCRTGVCGTCVVKVDAFGDLPPASEDEVEILDVYAEGISNARLCCQILLVADLAVEAIKER